MIATDELRRLLDERGVEYKRHYLNTLWYAGTKLYMATDNMDGTLTVDNLTPEQAVAATLGSELNARAERTCNLGAEVSVFDVTLNMLADIPWYWCLSCGAATPSISNYCMHCGAKVVGE